MNEKLFNTIVDNLKNIKNSVLCGIFTDDETSDYIDYEIEQGNIVKHSTFNFTCHGLVDKINKELPENIRLEAEDADKPNEKIIVRIKGGQGCYFLLYKDGKPIKSGILTWYSSQFIILFDLNE